MRLVVYRHEGMKSSGVHTQLSVCGAHGGKVRSVLFILHLYPSLGQGTLTFYLFFTIGSPTPASVYGYTKCAGYKKGICLHRLDAPRDEMRSQFVNYEFEAMLS